MSTLTLVTKGGILLIKEADKALETREKKQHNGVSGNPIRRCAVVKSDDKTLLGDGRAHQLSYFFATHEHATENRAHAEAATHAVGSHA